MAINITARATLSSNVRQINTYNNKLYAWSSDASSGTMVEMDVSGNITNSNLFTMSGTTWFPFVIDNDGNFYVSYTGSAVYKYSNSGVFIGNIASISGYVGGADLQNNRLYFYNYTAGVIGYISNFTTSPTVTNSWLNVGGYVIDGCTVNGSYDLVVGFNNGSLKKYTFPTGTVTTIISGLGECRQPAYDVSSNCYYISNYTTGWVRKYSSAGALLDSCSPAIKSIGTAFGNGSLYAVKWTPGTSSVIYSNQSSGGIGQNSSFLMFM